jgi:hypothetical protein
MVTKSADLNRSATLHRGKHAGLPSQRSQRRPQVINECALTQMHRYIEFDHGYKTRSLTATDKGAEWPVRASSTAGIRLPCRLLTMPMNEEEERRRHCGSSCIGGEDRRNPGLAAVWLSSSVTIKDGGTSLIFGWYR